MNALSDPIVIYSMISLPNASLVEPSDLCEMRDPISSWGHVPIRNYFLVVVVFLVVLSSVFLVVEVAFEVICAVVLMVAAGALVVVAPVVELEAGVLAPEALDAALALVARVVPEPAASVLEATELVLVLAVPEDAVFQ